MQGMIYLDRALLALQQTSWMPCLILAIVRLIGAAHFPAKWSLFPMIASTLIWLALRVAYCIAGWLSDLTDP